MANKKVLLMIVKGITDEIALSGIIQQQFSTTHLYVHVVHGDITSDEKITTKNIEAKIYEILLKTMSVNYWNEKDFCGILHLSDTDGTFIDSNYVFQDNSLSSGENIYSTKNIRTYDKTAIVRRNNQKSENMLKLSKINNIKKIPYGLFFMSINLDHLLYDRLNLSSDEKENYAYEFAEKYDSNLSGFWNLIKSLGTNFDSYKNSWNYIKKNLNSLSRCTNLMFCVNKFVKK